MYQIKLTNNPRYSLAETAQMAVEGGCQWIVVGAEAAQTNDVRSLAVDLVPLCREAGVILTIENNVEVARELSAHGVLVGVGKNAFAVREDLGPEAIIGAEAASSQAAVELAKADIDYVVLPADMSPQKAAEIIAQTRQAGFDIAFTATVDARNFDPEALLAVGYAGFYVVDGVFDAPDPVAFIESLVEKR